MDIQDQHIAAKIESIWEEAERLFAQEDFVQYGLKLNAAWDLLPSPKETYYESYDIARFITENYLLQQDYSNAHKWAEVLQQCDMERTHDGEREFVLGKVLYELGETENAATRFMVAMQKSGGRVFVGADEKYLHALNTMIATVEEELPDEVYQQIELLSEEGNELADDDNYDGAIEKFNTALQLVPEPKHQWEASTWLYASLGDMYFFKGDFKTAATHFFDALNCPDALGNGFIHLRLGEALYELKQEEKSLEHLLRAYMLEGEEIFGDENDKYFDFLQDRVEL
ncbi:tetratricopeptide repeat protein [Chitinophaga nivalis]|uniref:Tetratricopeptide repeat protein n=1 Tax=Chitinophaga nivalis TaxID=2991709 RepID=A0ABT3IEA1_9BACT|nr:hypothetical protein [Chitinophaga nivalis]MCW3468027.1 hypothetical protein [Chitinophaga nivalis]MCW3482282.1 hypothetical protein [Chitinophaga nivalis]